MAAAATAANALAAESVQACGSPRDDATAMAAAPGGLPAPHGSVPAGLLQTAQALAPAPLAAPAHQAALASHPMSPAFAGDLTAEVKLMVDGGLQQAELRLNPADLGPIRIQLQVDAQSQTAGVTFAAAHAATREGIEQSLPVLRDMLASQGLSLGHAGVSSGHGGGAAQQQAQEQTRMAGERRGRGGDGHGLGGHGGLGAAATVTVRVPRGMLDLYA